MVLNEFEKQFSDLLHRAIEKTCKFNISRIFGKSP